MCELLGMSFNEPISPKHSFSGLKHRANNNPDGWGIGFYPENKLQIIKEPVRCDTSPLSDFLVNYEFNSKVVITHIRRASKGGHVYANTHPFERILDGKEYCFAHNGTINTRLNTGDFSVTGATDSENIFLYLLNEIKTKGVNQWNSESFAWLESKLRSINEQGTLNCLLSDGKNLFCYSDRTAHNTGLKFFHRQPPYGTARFIDEDIEVDFSQEKSPTQQGYIISTKKLTDENWTQFKNAELVVFNNGNLVYPAKRLTVSITDRGRSFLTGEEEDNINVLRAILSSPHAAGIGEICTETNLESETVKSIIKSLVNTGFLNICQGKYYTNPDKRKEIHRLVGEEQFK